MMFLGSRLIASDPTSSSLLRKRRFSDAVGHPSRSTHSLNPLVPTPYIDDKQEATYGSIRRRDRYNHPTPMSYRKEMVAVQVSGNAGVHPLRTRVSTRVDLFLGRR